MKKNELRQLLNRVTFKSNLKKMRIRNFFMLAFAGLAFAACSDDGMNDGDDEQSVDKNGEAWVSVRIQATEGARGLHDPDEENATVNETQISTARAIFFKDGTGNAPKIVVKDVSLQGSNLGFPGQSTGLGGAAFSVPQEAKYILIVTNPSSRFPATFDGTKTYDDVNAAITAATVDDVIGSSKNNFMMTNAKGSLEPSAADGTLEPLTLYATAAAAESSPQAIHVDRVAAKVRLNTAANIGDNTNAKIYGIGWVLNVTNKKFFPVSERTPTWNEGAKDNSTDGYTATPAGTGWTVGASSPAGNYPLNTFRSPFDKYSKGSYRIDPNYRTGNDLSVGYADNYDAYTSTTDPSTLTWLADKGVAYCLENTQIQKYNKRAFTTQVLLRAQYAPKNLQDYSGSPVPLAKDESWIRIGANGYYTVVSLATYIEAELKLKFPSNESGDPTAIQTPLTSAFNEFLKTNPGEDKSISIPLDWEAFKTAYGEGGDLDPTKINAGITDLKGKFAAVTGLKAGTVGSVSYFDGGWNYYRIMIKHDDVDALDASGTQGAFNELGEFGVVRNSVYDITVNKIMNVGYPTIPDPDEEDDEDDEMLISVQININPWTWYTQSENL